jgi:phospholipid/cholesterol/gamma-HCH transport system ATP-binding protein
MMPGALSWKKPKSDPTQSATRSRFTGGASEDDIVIRVKGLEKGFDAKRVLKGIDFEVRRGETVVLMGGSGCGKSTVLRHLIGVLAPDEGTVEIFGRDVSALDEDDLARVRKRFGILFQSGALFNSMTVGENIALPLREHTDLGKEIINIIVKMKLELVGLREAESLMPAQLSGGMRKRVGLARAIALDPEVVFYDEPTTGLDPIVTGVIDKLINDFKQGMGISSVVVTHDMESAFRIADRMIMLYDGRVVAEGTPEEIRSSEDPLVKQFIHGHPDGPIPLRLSKVDYETDLFGLIRLEKST